MFWLYSSLLPFFPRDVAVTGAGGGWTGGWICCATGGGCWAGFFLLLLSGGACGGALTLLGGWMSGSFMTGWSGGWATYGGMIKCYWLPIDSIGYWGNA